MRTPKNLTRHVSKKKTQKKSSCASILTDLRRDDATLWPTERKNLQHQLRGGGGPSLFLSTSPPNWQPPARGFKRHERVSQPSTRIPPAHQRTTTTSPHPPSCPTLPSSSRLQHARRSPAAPQPPAAPRMLLRLRSRRQGLEAGVQRRHGVHRGLHARRQQQHDE